MPTPSTRIVLLGRISIEQGDRAPEAGLSGRRAETVFAYLAVHHGRAVSRDALATALWPEALPDTWNAALRTVLSEVRRFLERGGLDPATTLRTEHGRLRLDLPPGTTLDLDDARVALAAARDHHAAGEMAAAAQAAGDAAARAEQPFLAAHDDAWVDDVRTDLDRLYVDALQVQAAALAGVGDCSAALTAVDRLLRADPYLESGHQLRIELLGRLGDRAGARKAYERCQALLATELGIEPSPATTAALQAALAPDPGAAPASVPAALAARSVLVVEDHDFQRRTTLALLRGLGVGALHEAADGTAALALLDGAVTPDVIVCDIDMPGMDGVEFIRHVAERELATAVVIASGLDPRVLDTVRAASEGYGLQVLGAVPKPLTAAALERLLAELRPASADPPQTGTTAAFAAVIDALDDGSLAARFEPVIDLAVGRITGLRATLDTTIGGDLLAAADASGLGRPLVEHLVRQVRVAARDLALEAFVELPPSLLTDVSLADGLAAITREPVVFVVRAEALSASGGPAMLDVLARLRVKGFGLGLDGADPELLGRLPLTHVALPGGLVRRAAEAGDPSPLLPTVDASRSLGLPVIGRCATEAEFELLLQAGCSFAHGPYLSPAVAAAEIRQVTRTWTAPPVSGPAP